MKTILLIVGGIVGIIILFFAVCYFWVTRELKNIFRTLEFDNDPF